VVSADTKSVIESAKRLYAEQLQAALEPLHLNRFVAIEPEPASISWAIRSGGGLPALHGWKGQPLR